MAIYIAAFNLAVLFAPMDILMCFWDVVGESGPPVVPGISNSCTYASLVDPSRSARPLLGTHAMFLSDRTPRRSVLRGPANSSSA